MRKVLPIFLFTLLSIFILGTSLGNQGNQGNPFNDVVDLLKSSERDSDGYHNRIINVFPYSYLMCWNPDKETIGIGKSIGVKMVSVIKVKDRYQILFSDDIRSKYSTSVEVSREKAEALVTMFIKEINKSTFI